MLGPADPALAGQPAPPVRRRRRPELPGAHPQLAARTGLVWCIADAKDDRCLGSIGLEGLSSYAPRAEIGYWAHPQARGRGTVTAAVRLVTGYARSAGLAASIVIRCAAANTASRHVAEAAGYREVGRMPQAEPVGSGELSELICMPSRGRYGRICRVTCV